MSSEERPSDIDRGDLEEAASDSAGRQAAAAGDGMPRHAKHAATPIEDFDDEENEASDEEEPDTGDKDASSGDNVTPGSQSEEMPAYMRRSRRTRHVLIAVIIILIVLLALGAFLAFTIFSSSQEEAAQQIQEDDEVVVVIEEENTDDATQASEKSTTVPQLVPLLGLTVDQAVEQLQHGAEVSSTREINDEDDPIKTETRVVLTAEPSDPRSGTPTVYLGLDEAGTIIQAGYSAATTLLGYGSLSFADVVANEKIIENTLLEAGIGIGDGVVSLPDDKDEYTTYTSDGTTLSREYCSFYGDINIDGTAYEWSSVLSYDYVTANVTGNLSDTIRTIYVYIGV